MVAADVTIRTAREEELVESARLVARVMLGSTTDDIAKAWSEHFETERTHLAVLPDGEQAAVVRWFESDVALPGGAAPTGLVSAVAVSPVHRRQGLLTRLMHAQLEAIAAEEKPLAMLVSAEWPIYGRFGYGPSIDACAWRIDALTARFRAPAVGSVAEVSTAELRPHLETVHDQRWARTPGAVTRLPYVWDRLAGLAAWPSETFEPGQRRGALWRDPSGAVLGAVAYSVKEHWVDNRPRGTARVHLLVGATPEAERELWRHLCALDWIATVEAEVRPVDDPLRHHLVDGRAAVAYDRSDHIWSRILDVRGTFEAFRPVDDRAATIEVVDPLGYANGRWRLELGPDGAEVTTTTATADVRLPVESLATLHLGATSVASLHDAGLVDEESPGGLGRLQRFVATPRAPWSPTGY